MDGTIKQQTEAIMLTGEDRAWRMRLPQQPRCSPLDGSERTKRNPQVLTLPSPGTPPSIRPESSPRWMAHVAVNLACLAALALAALVCVSRVYLHYHTLQQVVIGGLLGCVLGALWRVAVRHMRPLLAWIAATSLARTLLIRVRLPTGRKRSREKPFALQEGRETWRKRLVCQLVENSCRKEES